jgi:outer membrane receptor protein involved in Fe transport
VSRIHRTIRPLAWLCLSTFACTDLVHAAAPATQIEEVLVTADFRDTQLDRLAASASVIRPNDAGTVVNHLDEILSRAPNVNFSAGASRGRFIQIRGIGERGQFSEPLNPSVGLLVDGVDLSGIGNAATLFDVQQVEILRGPQGTLYGANALAGLINITTPDPTAEHMARVRIDAGDYDALGYGGVVSGPIGEHAGYRISAQRHRDDGFSRNAFLNQDDTNKREESTLRAKFRWANERSTWNLAAGYVNADNGYDAFSLDNDRTTLSDEPGHDEQISRYIALSLQHTLNDSVQLEVAGAFAHSELDYGYDEDWTFAGFDPIGYVSTDRYERERDTATLDVRWLDTPGDGDGWDWLAGVYVFRQDVDLTRSYTFLPGPFDTRFEVERTAVYGELSRQFNRQWRLTVGLRGERHRSDYRDSEGVSFDPSDNLVGGRIVLERTLSSGNLLYLGVNRGYKAGGFNQDGSLDPEFREFNPEHLWNIEVGYKGQWLDDRLSLRAALFRMQRADVQIATSTTRPIPNSPAVEFIEFTGNAADGFNQGLEAELRWRAMPNLDLFANVGWLDTEFDEYIDASGRDLSGRDQAQAPSYQFFAGVEYYFAPGWSARVEVEGRDDYFFSDSHSEQSPAYELINASIGFEAERWRVRAWGRNLADQDYFVRGFFFGNDPRDFYTARGFTQLGEPRQVGISWEMEF